MINEPNNQTIKQPKNNNQIITYELNRLFCLSLAVGRMAHVLGQVFLAWIFSLGFENRFPCNLRENRQRTIPSSLIVRKFFVCLAYLGASVSICTKETVNVLTKFIDSQNVPFAFPGNRLPPILFDLLA